MIRSPVAIGGAFVYAGPTHVAGLGAFAGDAKIARNAKDADFAKIANVRGNRKIPVSAPRENPLIH